jgi:hypothetical protein
MIGTNEVQSENIKRAKAETNRNSAIAGMFTNAGKAIKSGSESKLFGGNQPFFEKTT